ncbi:MAG: hypothetical protein JNL08_04730 [Planctomycetes bacterium]|nr:hypothetical protein [Planctomycetota bacterium]
MTRPSRTSFRTRLFCALALGLVGTVATCGGSAPARYAGQGHGSPGQPHGAGAWSHRSSQGGGDMSVGGDGSGFYYYIDSSGSSWTGG